MTAAPLCRGPVPRRQWYSQWRKRRRSLLLLLGAATGDEKLMQFRGQCPGASNRRDIAGWVDEYPEGVTEGGADFLEVIVDDDIVERAVDAILDAAYTGRIGDGKIFLYKVESAIRIRSRERGIAAL